MRSPTSRDRSSPRTAPGTRHAALAGAALVAATLLGGCFEAPPVDSEQIGFRGVGMQTMQSTERADALAAANVLPAALPAPPEGGPLAKDIYQNVQVLGDLSVAEFTRTMAAITAWVSPDAGCTYCHVGNNFASDAVYTKVVSRRMMQMTQNINSEWDSHVGDTGVTCLTCHRGNPVPEYIWFDTLEPNRQGGFAANSYGQNHANTNVGSTSMLDDPFSHYLTADQAPIRVISNTALPIRDVKQNLSTQSTENTYSLMVHMSTSLGQNCTFCHNTRAFTDWEQSPPQRTTAWHALRMVPALNQTYLEPLGPVYPMSRMGPKGDAPKVNCTTCHQGLNKPFYGVGMLDDYPVWKAPGPNAAIEAVDPMVPVEAQPAQEGEVEGEVEGGAEEGAEGEAETTSALELPDDRLGALDVDDGATVVR